MTTFLSQLLTDIADMISEGVLVSRVVIADANTTYTGYTFKKDANLTDRCWLVKRTLKSGSTVFAETWADECRDANNPQLMVFCASMDGLSGLTFPDQEAVNLPDGTVTIGEATVLSDVAVDVDFTYTFTTHPKCSFRKEYSDDDGDTWQDGGDMADENATDDAITAHFTGLTAETPYLFRIVPFNATGDGAASGTVAATTEAGS